MTFLPKRRPILPEVLLLVALSLGLALVVNLVRPHGLPLFQDWTEQQAPGGLEADLDRALALHAAGQALFVDARPNSQYRDIRIPGAANLPVESVKQGDGPVPLILYCSNKDCGMSEELAKLLESRGLAIQVLTPGVTGWLGAGGPLGGD